MPTVLAPLDFVVTIFSDLRNHLRTGEDHVIIKKHLNCTDLQLFAVLFLKFQTKHFKRQRNILDFIFFSKV